MRIVTIAASIAIAIVCLCLVLQNYLRVGLIYNTTPSVPRGLYWWSAPRNWQPERGQLVLMCPWDSSIFREAKDRHFISAGYCSDGFQGLLKPVVAIPGDRIKISSTGIEVNGIKLLSSAQFSWSDEPLPKVEYLLAQGQYLVAVPRVDSFDSRYFGSVPRDHIIGLLHPLITVL